MSESNEILHYRWFEVEKVAVDEIAPIDHACETVAAKNAELRHLATTAENSKNSGLKLTQILQGVIDAAVNGGVAKYASAFFEAYVVEDDPSAPGGDAGKVQRLQELLMEQVNVLETALATHSRLASAEIRPLHDHLMERFSVMKATLPHQIRLSCQTTHGGSLTNMARVMNNWLLSCPHKEL